ncbi:baseplate J/gp47 family protein [Sulfurivirga sp.]|uniref:baseplate assembly protein n=1 Tax=Sulfurivirga sp. TaxID=2614236 RepID=UPI0025F85283|nr:baseplate J/gp47 family protein [Sulfurivirga sp.]
MSIDLSKLPAPEVIEPLDYEAILTSLQDDFARRWPDYSREPHDPITKALEVAAYRELILRARINDAARANLLAHATGADLDNLAAFWGVERALIDAGNPQATPPVPPVWESDDRLRARVLLAHGALTTAGSRASYTYHTLSASPQVKDVAVTSPAPGEVVVTVLSTEGDGTPDQALLDAVAEALNDEKVRPLTDHVTVQGADILPYTVDAVLTVYPGPSPQPVLDEARARLERMVAGRHRLGFDVPASAIYGALHVEGVQKVTLNGFADMVVGPVQAAFCTGITLSVGGADV